MEGNIMARISKKKILEEQRRSEDISKKEFVRGYATCLAYFQQGMDLDEVEKLFYDYLDENEKQKDKTI